MPLIYGSSNKPPILKSGEVGSSMIKQKPKKDDSWATVLKWAITIGEIAISLTGIGAVGSTALAIGSAIGRTTIDVAAGNKLSAVNVGMDFGFALLPALGMVRNAGRFTKAESAFAHLPDVRGKGLGALDLIGEAAAKEAGGMKIWKTFSPEVREHLIMEMTKKTAAKAMLAETGKFARLNNGIKGMEDTILKYGGDAATSEWLIGDVENALVRGGDSVSDAEEMLRRQIKKTLDDADIIILAERLSKYDLRYLYSADDVKSLFINELRDMGKTEFQIEEILGGIQNVKTKNLNFVERSEWFKHNPQGKVRQFVKALSKPGSSKFNQWIVQKVQMLFDTNDLGRAGAEMIYQFVKKHLDEGFAKLSKLIGKVGKAAKKLDDAWTRTGGILVESEVVLGYKILQKLPGKSLVVIQFYPEATKSKRNPHGKEPVIVTSSMKDLKRLKEEGMSYYLKRWATSKNGAGVGKLIGTGSSLRLRTTSNIVLAFLPISALRNILSITSNIVENSIKYTKVNGKWVAQGAGFEGGIIGVLRGKVNFDDLWKTFQRTGVNRMGRLASRGIIGGLATAVLGRRIGSLIGRETQRIATQMILPGIKNKAEGLSFTGSGWKRDKSGRLRFYKGKSAGNMFGRMFMKTASTGAKRRLRRKHPDSNYLKVASGKRKGNMVFRIGSATTPDKTINPRALRIKL